MKFRTVFLVLFLLVLIAGALAWALRKPRYHSSPASVREWERNYFTQSVRATAIPIEAFPPLSESGPMPEFEILRHDDESCNVKYTHDRNAAARDLITTIVAADEKQVVRLPGGGEIRVSALAMAMPEDFPDPTSLEDFNAMTQEDPGWLDPVSRMPLKLPEEAQPVRAFGQPALHLLLENEGVEVKFLQAEIFDARTMSRTGYAEPVEGAGQYSLSLGTWHATELVLVVSFAYGAPEVLELPVQEGSGVQFGDEVRVDTIVKFSDLFLQVLGSAGGNEFERGFERFEATRFNWGMDKGSAILFVTPAWARESVSYWKESSSNWFPLSDGSLTDLVQVPVDVKRNDSIRLRRLPSFGKAVFRFSPFSSLPESANLFTTPIRKVVIRGSGEWAEMVAEATQTTHDLWSMSVDEAFPIVVYDTTPEGAHKTVGAGLAAGDSLQRNQANLEGREAETFPQVMEAQIPALVERGLAVVIWISVQPTARNDTRGWTSFVAFDLPIRQETPESEITEQRSESE